MLTQAPRRKNCFTPLFRLGGRSGVLLWPGFILKKSPNYGINTFHVAKHPVLHIPVPSKINYVIFLSSVVIVIV